MDRKKLQIFWLCFAFIFSSGTLLAQQTNTLYFVENSPLRHMFNPAFQPQKDFYVSFPLLGYVGGELGNNSLKLNDLIYDQNGGMTSFLNSRDGIDQFYSTLKDNALFYSGFQLNLISFGFKLKSSFLNFTVSERMLVSANFPKYIFGLSLYGTAFTNSNDYDFSPVQANFSAYTELALGYSKRKNKNWTVGGKLKILLGHANASNTNNYFNLQSDVLGWRFNGVIVANISSPIPVSLSQDNRSFSFALPSNLSDWFKPSGLGLGIDMGVVYSLNDKTNVSASILDLGFIGWSKNTLNLNYTIDYVFQEITQRQGNPVFNDIEAVYNQMIIYNPLVDTLKTAFDRSISSSRSLDNYITLTSPKLNVSIEYNFHKKFGVGLLSKTQLFKNMLAEEATLAFNMRPYSWLNGSLSYSLINGTFSTFGLALGLNLANANVFLATDYIPTQHLTFNPADYNATLPDCDIPIPYNSRGFNFSLGINLVFDYISPADARNLKSNRSRTGRGYLRAGKTSILNSSKGLHVSKSKSDCRCESK